MGTAAVGKVLVVGATGLIGQQVFACLRRRGVPVIGTCHRPSDSEFLRLDLADAAKTPLPRGIRFAVLCGAVSEVRRCEETPDLTGSVNVDGTLTLARRLTAGGAFVIFPSTSLVHEGTVPNAPSEAALARPHTEYARQKLAAEKGLLALSDRVAVVRLSKVLHWSLPLLSKWWTSLIGGIPIEPFSDLMMAPVPAEQVARLMLCLGDRRSPGIYQWSAADQVSYLQLAEEMVARSGADRALLRPRSAREFGFAAEDLPVHTTLASTALEALCGEGRPLALEVCREVVEQLATARGLRER